MSEYPKIISNFISNEEITRIESFLDSIATPAPHMDALRVCLGYQNSMIASKIGYEHPVLNGYGSGEHSETVKDIGNILLRTKSVLEEEFGQAMDTVNFLYQQLLEGGFNRLHSDSTNLDGTPLSDDGTPEETEWSALLYLTSGGGEDFEGGELIFPKQELTYVPVKGDLVFFIGDVHHPHRVAKVTSGVRSTLVSFFARKGNVSEVIAFHD
jgi:predicted 2-oxoglutarate/Fe(II)-dependent dioxygenase YbiX